MKKFLVSVLVVTAVATPVFAATSSPAPSLAPGKPAGVKPAQIVDDGGRGMLLIAGASAIGIGIALAVADNGPGAVNTAANPPTSSTSSTTP